MMDQYGDTIYIPFNIFLTDSNNIFAYTANVAEIDQWFDIRDLKRNYDMLRIVENHYDKILWVCFPLITKKVTVSTLRSSLFCLITFMGNIFKNTQVYFFILV